ncbi:hypothetical protein SBOR_5643 [Sclerotinia borealis F-4128]|uniref:Uncharacterized protein n=1 Tax=Sclerotinia borealis (strain F-4128) TaxID=1432307 RepID=W9CDQ6_SCLBF|nr:hypothetical protein SBOR_5643 [Sclerotinia borealis F-4128]
MPTPGPLGDAFRRLGDLRRRNRPNQRRVSTYHPPQDITESPESSEPIASPESVESVLPPVYQSQMNRERQLVIRVSSDMHSNSIEQLERELLVSDNEQGLANQVHMDGLYAALADLPALPPSLYPPHINVESYTFDLYQDTYSRNEVWYIRKAAIEELLLPVHTHLDEIDW